MIYYTQFALQQNLTPLHRAAMKGDYKLMLKMINKIRDEGTPLPDIVETCEDDRIAQVKFHRYRSGHADWVIVNKKNKVSCKPTEGGGAYHITVIVWMDCTTLCYRWWVCQCITSSTNGKGM